MKNIYHILSILLGYMITLASCQSEKLSGTDNFEENVFPIEFAGIKAEVDTKTTTSTIPESFTGFKVWASRTVSDAAQPNYNVFGTTGTDVEKSGSGTSLSWIYTPVRYWQTGTYNFHAIWPTSIASTPIAGSLGSSGLSLSFGNGGWDLSANQIDLMSATTQVTNTTGTPGQVVLTFNHMLSKISFSARNASVEDTDIIITGVKIYGNSKKATRYSSTWLHNNSTSTKDSPYLNHTLSSAVTLPKPVEGEDLEYASISPEFLVFPGELCTLMIEVSMKHTANSTAYTKTASLSLTYDDDYDYVWEAGKQYDYKVNVTPEYIRFDEVKVTLWDDNGGLGYGADDDVIEF